MVECLGKNSLEEELNVLNLPHERISLNSRYCSWPSWKALISFLMSYLGHFHRILGPKFPEVDDLTFACVLLLYHKIWEEHWKFFPLWDINILRWPLDYKSIGSSHTMAFFKNTTLRSFAKFTGKQLGWRL